MWGITKQMIRIAEDPRFDKEDAGTVAGILAEMDTTDKETRKAMLARLYEIYQRNYHTIRNDKKNHKTQ